VAIIATVLYSVVRQPTDRNSAPYHLERGSGVLFFPLSLSLCACLSGEGDSPSPISLCWHEPSIEHGRCTLFTSQQVAHGTAYFAFLCGSSSRIHDKKHRNAARIREEPRGNPSAAGHLRVTPTSGLRSWQCDSLATEASYNRLRAINGVGFTNQPGRMSANRGCNPHDGAAAGFGLRRQIRFALKYVFQALFKPTWLSTGPAAQP
jgi:hypothetical protein